MSKIKRIINCVIPVTVCNFKCHYCYLAQTNSFDKNIPKLEYEVEHILKALNIKRLGGACMMNICAVGETLMAPYLIELSKGLLENGHYVTIVTNGTITERIKQFCHLDDDLKKRLFFKFSYQYLELKKRNLINVFFDNVELIRKAGISFSIELTANDESIPYIDKLSDICYKKTGALPHIIESRDNNNGLKKLTKIDNKTHMKEWSKCKSPLIKFQNKIWGEKRKEFCYAGCWVLNLYLQNGNISPCFGGGPIIQNIFEDIDEPIHYVPVGNKCPWEHCYAAHVLLTLGAIPELKTPFYSQLRDRITIDKKHWLTKDMQEILSSKFVQSNEEYSKEQKLIIYWYRDIEMNKIGNNNTKNLSKIIEKIFYKNNIKSLAIYDNYKYNASFQKIIKNTHIKLKYILYPKNIEKNNIKNIIKSNFKYLVKLTLNRDTIPVLNYNDKKPKVDAIIVFDSYNYSKIKKEVENKLKVKTYLITEMDVNK